ncbi:MAG: TPM domain-containing protein [Bacteroidales bacterium]|nr:TPM domain-containing protein [Bacteroidales bacterium]
MKQLLFTFLGAMMFTLAVALPKKPYPPKLVNDYAGVFTNEQIFTLENKLADFSNRTTTQIVVVTLDTLYGMPVSMAAQKIGESWGVGGEEFDNGLVVLFKPKTSLSKGEVSIQTGYGLEAVIPDAICNRIVQYEMIPKFQQNNIFGGIDAALEVLMGLSLKEFSAKDYENKTGSKGKTSGFIVVLVMIILFFSGIFSKSNRARRSSLGSSNLPLWLLLSMMGSGRGGSHSGSFGNFSSGRGSFGGGGSFGGFGGGSFGGGGASGSW